MFLRYLHDLQIMSLSITLNPPVPKIPQNSLTIILIKVKRKQQKYHIIVLIINHLMKEVLVDTRKRKNSRSGRLLQCISQRVTKKLQLDKNK